MLLATTFARSVALVLLLSVSASLPDPDAPQYQRAVVAAGQCQPGLNWDGCADYGSIPGALPAPPQPLPVFRKRDAAGWKPLPAINVTNDNRRRALVRTPFHGTMISIFAGHGGSLVVATNGTVTLSLDIDKALGYTSGWARIRSPNSQVREGWQTLLQKYACQFPGCQFDYLLHGTRFYGNKYKEYPYTAAGVFHFRDVVKIDHFDAHAAHAFYDSPFERAVVVVSDGMNQNTLYLADRQRGWVRVAVTTGNWGLMYVAAVVELFHMPEPRYHPDFNRFMHLASQGTPRPEQWRGDVEACLTLGWTEMVKRMRATVAPLTTEAQQRDFAATVQALLGDYFVHFVRRGLRAAGAQKPDGVAFGGGVAFNTLMVAAVRERCRVRVYVPACPGDECIALGMALAMLQPRSPGPCSHGLDMFAWDRDEVPRLVRKHRWARRTEAAEVAALLAGGHAVGVLQGRSTPGYFTYGSRSVLTAPSRAAGVTLPRLLAPDDPRLFRSAAPLVPMVPPQALQLAPWVLEAAPERFGALQGKAWVQVVSAASYPWLFAVLQHVGNSTGLPVLVAEHLKGRAGVEVNSVVEGIELLQTSGTMDYLVVDEYLFQK